MHYNLNVNFNKTDKKMSSVCLRFGRFGTRQSLHNLCASTIETYRNQSTDRYYQNVCKSITSESSRISARVHKAQISISNQWIIQTNNFHTLFFRACVEPIVCRGYQWPDGAEKYIWEIYDFRSKQNFDLFRFFFYLFSFVFSRVAACPRLNF